MSEIKEKMTITPESVLEAVKKMFAETQDKLDKSAVEFDRRSAEFDRRSAEFDRRSEDFNRDLAQSRADHEKWSADFNRKLEKSRSDHEKWSADFDRKLEMSEAKFEKRMAKLDRQFAKSQADFERRTAETDRQFKQLGKMIGGLSNNHGTFAEEYFFNSFENGKKTFFGEKFDDCLKNVPGVLYKDEYDILLINGQSVGIVEIKHTAHGKDIDDVLGKAKSIKINYPNFHHHRVFLGLASLVFDPTVEKLCTDQGIAVIKQVGDLVVVNEDNLKAF